MLKQRQGSKALHSQRAIASAPFGIINLRKDQAAPLCVLYKRPAPPFLQASHARTPGYSFPQGQGTHLGAFTCQPLSPAGIQCSPFSRSLLLLQFLSPPPPPLHPLPFPSSCSSASSPSSSLLHHTSLCPSTQPSSTARGQIGQCMESFRKRCGPG